MRRAVLSCCIFAFAAFSSDIHAKAQDYYEMVQDTKTYFDSNGNQVNDIYLGFDKYSPGIDAYTHFNADENTSLLLRREVWDPVSDKLVSNVINYSVGGDVKTSGSTAYMYITEYENNNWLDTKLRLEYDLETGEYEINNVDTHHVFNSGFSVLSTNGSSGSSMVSEGSDGSIVLGSSSAITSLKIGTGVNPTTIHGNGLKVGGENLIRRSSDGAVHIGKNSLVLKEVGGRQQMWATNAAGESIDIDITNGSRLLINGRDVEKSIDNVGALSAALGSVPAISADSPFTCGFGAGTHSSAYAISGGCASRVSDRVSVNAAIATVINNGTGDSDDNVSARAGFTFKLGNVDDSPKVAARKAAELHDKVSKLEERNERLLALLQAQSSRLERLEGIASGQLLPLADRASSD